MYGKGRDPVGSDAVAHAQVICRLDDLSRDFLKTPEKTLFDGLETGNVWGFWWQPRVSG